MCISHPQRASIPDRRSCIQNIDAVPIKRHRTLCLSLGGTLRSSATTDTFHGRLVDDGLCFCSGPPRRSASGKRIGNGDDGDDDDDDDDAVVMMGVIVMMRNEQVSGNGQTVMRSAHGKQKMCGADREAGVGTNVQRSMAALPSRENWRSRHNLANLECSQPWPVVARGFLCPSTRPRPSRLRR